MAVALAGCTRVESSGPDPSDRATPAPSASLKVLTTPPTTPPSATATSNAPLMLARGVRFIHAGADSDVARLVRSERDKVKADGRDLIVYVGAKWCEPCQHFHQAALRGDLDSEFPELSILEFDLDDDRDRLVSAGYESKLIPLFIYPADDGRAGDRRFEGSVKGNGAVANISPRLHRLLAK